MNNEQLFAKLKVLALSTIHTPSNNYILLNLVENNPEHEEVLIDVVEHCLVYEDILKWGKAGIAIDDEFLEDKAVRHFKMTIYLKNFLQKKPSFVWIIDQLLEVDYDIKKHDAIYKEVTCPTPRINQEAIRAKAWQIVKEFICTYDLFNE